MRTVSSDFKAAMKAPVRTMRGKLVIDENDEITSADDLIRLTIAAEGGIGRTAMRKLDAKYIGTRNLVGTVIEVKIGVKLASGSFEDMSYGRYLITTSTTDKASGTTSLTGYDMLVYTMLAYKPLLFTYPTTLGGLLDQIGTATNLTMPATVPFDALAVDVDLYENISGTKYRDIIEQASILGNTVAIIDENNSLALRSIKTPTNTVETITYADLKKLTLCDKYGEINSLVLSRSPQEDNVAVQNAASIEANGLTEIKIVNNELVDDQRETLIDDIFDYFDGTNYYPFSANTVGLGWYEIGDKVIIEDAESTEREVRIMGFKLTLDAGFKETLYAIEPTKTETNYAIAGSVDNRIKNTELKVDHQNQQIVSIISDLYDEGGVVNQNYTEIMQNVNEIVNTVQTSGGSNLLLNSAMYALTNGLPDYWTLSGTGTFNVQTSSEATANGSISNNAITLIGVTAKQRVTVVADDPDRPENSKTYYSFNVKVKKGTTGTATITISNGVESYTQTIPAGTSKLYDDIEIKALLPQSTYYDIELSGSSDSDAAFTDPMFSIGKYRSNWQQASGEILNTQVNINENGIVVKSSVYLGDYTSITPLEFSGYAKIGGTVTKVFTLNRDQTEVKKLYASDEVTINPVRIVGITTGTTTGIAFVKK